MTEIPPAPSRRHKFEGNREEKIWDMVRAILGNVDMGAEMDEMNLMKLKEKLKLEVRQHRGRRLGQKKLVSAINKKYYSFFRCVYSKLGGRKKLHYDEHFVKNNGQVIYNMLKYFWAHLDIPKDDFAVDGDHLLEETDRFILRYLRDRKEHVNPSEILEQEGNSTDPCNDILPTVDTATADASNGPDTLSETALTSQVPNATTALPENCPLHPLGITSKIPYLCPPNHTTLVGFRTFLLSRRNIALNADNVDRQFKSLDTDMTDSDGSSVSCSEQITPVEAAALWKERLASLFVWPAIMSNAGPKVMDHLFQSDDPPVASTSHGITDGSETENISTSNCGASVTKSRTSRKLAKKRKRRKKKEKDVALSPPQKKRKYEKSGKYKKPPQYVVQRRSTRHSSDPASGLLELKTHKVEV
jgi:hypothetical protein